MNDIIEITEMYKASIPNNSSTFMKITSIFFNNMMDICYTNIKMLTKHVGLSFFCKDSLLLLGPDSYIIFKTEFFTFLRVSYEPF